MLSFFADSNVKARAISFMTLLLRHTFPRKRAPHKGFPFSQGLIFQWGAWKELPTTESANRNGNPV